jgi:hypothetical protein
VDFWKGNHYFTKFKTRSTLIATNFHLPTLMGQQQKRQTLPSRLAPLIPTVHLLHLEQVGRHVQAQLATIVLQKCPHQLLLVTNDNHHFAGLLQQLIELEQQSHGLLHVGLLVRQHIRVGGQVQSNLMFDGQQLQQPNFPLIHRIRLLTTVLVRGQGHGNTIVPIDGLHKGDIELERHIVAILERHGHLLLVQKVLDQSDAQIDIGRPGNCLLDQQALNDAAVFVQLELQTEHVLVLQAFRVGQVAPVFRLNRIGQQGVVGEEEFAAWTRR